jgi:aryl-alcohol dehydrogenase-like predicted oxidoreductase
MDKVERVKLGNTGFEVSRVCFGTEHINCYTPEYGGNILADAARLFGVFFWDTDMVYGSHPQVASGLRKVQRDQVVVCSKTYALTKEEAQRDIERIYLELGVDYLDICLLHRVCVSKEKYRPALDVLLKEKEAGRIRSVGLSTHFVSVIEESLHVPDIEIVCAPLNRDGSRIDRGSREGMIAALTAAREGGKGTYVIKILGRGDLVHDLQNALEWVLQFYNVVDVFNIGIANLAELKQNIEIVNRFFGEGCSR